MSVDDSITACFFVCDRFTIIIICSLILGVTFLARTLYTQLNQDHECCLDLRGVHFFNY